MRLRVPVLLLAVLLPLGLVAGCSDDDPEVVRQDGPALPSQAELKAYFTAVAGYDVDGLAAAEEIAADGSPAQGYAAYLGESPPRRPRPVSRSNRPSGGGDGGFKACGGTGAGRVRVWSDFTGEDGRLTGFSVNGTKIGDSLVDLTGQAPISSPGLYEVQPEHAYRSPQSGTLFVLVTITAKDVPLSSRPGSTSSRTRS